MYDSFLNYSMFVHNHLHYRGLETWFATCLYTLFLHPDDKFPLGDHIDDFIFAKIPNLDLELVLHDATKNFIIHGLMDVLTRILLT